MRHNAENSTYREMNNGKTENYELPGIHGPGTREDCRNQRRGNLLQPEVQLSEQTTIAGDFRSWIPEHTPVKGEAG
jgi:hypothetical protein